MAKYRAWRIEADTIKSLTLRLVDCHCKRKPDKEFEAFELHRVIFRGYNLNSLKHTQKKSLLQHELLSKRSVFIYREDGKFS
jgi:hypothetical protein